MSDGSLCMVPDTSPVPSCSTTLPGGTSDAGRQKEPAASRSVANRRCAAGGPIRSEEGRYPLSGSGGELPFQLLAATRKAWGHSAVFAHTLLSQFWLLINDCG